MGEALPVGVTVDRARAIEQPTSRRLVVPVVYNQVPPAWEVVLVPDSQIAALIPGSVVRLDGELHARLVGGDYGSIRTTVTAERVTPLGDAAQILRGLAEKAPKPVETRPAA